MYVMDKKHKRICPDIKKSLQLYNPRQVYDALCTNREILRWLRFVSNHYVPPQKEILLLYPCSLTKPYTRSQSYRQLSKTLTALGRDRDRIHLMTVSEPLCVIPEEFYNKIDNWYDCPGLFRWACTKRKEPFSAEYLDKSIQILADYLASFLAKAKKKYSKIIAFVRTYSSTLNIKDDHTHRRIIEKAAEIARVNVALLPPPEVISRIVKARGRFAWDMYGVAHPIAQDYLLQYLREVLIED